MGPKAGRWAGVEVWLLEPPVALAGGAGEGGVEAELEELPELEAAEAVDERLAGDDGVVERWRVAALLVACPFLSRSLGARRTRACRARRGTVCRTLSRAPSGLAPAANDPGLKIGSNSWVFRPREG